MPKFTGLCRIAGVNGQPNRVRVTDGDMTWDDVDEAHYGFCCYTPSLEQLPWSQGFEPVVPAPKE